MNKTKVYIFLFDGFSDWEIAYVTPKIMKNENAVLKTFSLDGLPITSMGGLKIAPDMSLRELEVDEVSVLILPGGSAWEEQKISQLDDLTERLYANNKIIAAICAATTFLGERGYLNSARHTSNDLAYLKQLAPNYEGDKYYSTIPAITDKNIITANGTAPIEFAREIFKKIKLFNEENVEKWYQLFKYGFWSA